MGSPQTGQQMNSMSQHNYYSRFICDIGYPQVSKCVLLPYIADVVYQELPLIAFYRKNISLQITIFVYTIRSLHCIYQLLQKNPFYCNDHTITEFGITDNKNSSTAYVILYELIDTCFSDSNRRVGVWSLSWRWHILSIPLTTGRGTSTETCGLDDVFPPDDLGSCPEALCWYIYIHIYICNPYMSSVIGRIYIYIRPITELI